MATTDIEVTIIRGATFSIAEADYMKCLLQNAQVENESTEEYKLRENLFNCFKTLSDPYIER